MKTISAGKVKRPINQPNYFNFEINQPGTVSRLNQEAAKGQKSVALGTPNPALGNGTVTLNRVASGP